MIAVYFVLIGIPTLVYLSDRRRSRRTQAELEVDAVRVARGTGDGPGENLPITLPPGGPAPPAM